MSETKFKPGDKVRVKADLVVSMDAEVVYSMKNTTDSDIVTEEMIRMFGKECTIQSATGEGYRLKEDLSNWNWTDEMFEEIIPEYVECLQWSGSMFTKGKIYKTEGNFIINNSGNISTEYDHPCFKSSTKEKFDAQQLRDNPPKYYLCVTSLANAAEGKIYPAEGARVYTDNKDYYFVPSSQFTPSTKEAYDAQFKNKTLTFEEGDRLLCTSGAINFFTKGEIYQAVNSHELIDDDGDLHVVGFDWAYKHFRFATEEGTKSKEIEFKVGDTVEVIKPCASSSNPKGYVGTITSIVPGNLQGFGQCTCYMISDGSFEHYSGLKLLDAPKEWTVGTYVVFLENSLEYNTFNKGQVKQITSITESGEVIKFSNGMGNTIKGQGNVSAGIKWFPTFAEAEAFSKELLTPKITVESEMKRLGLAIGDRIKVTEERIKDGFHYEGEFSELAGVRGEEYTIFGGVMHNNSLYLSIQEDDANEVLATAVTKATLSIFYLGDYKVTVSAKQVKIGCTSLDRSKVVNFLTDFTDFVRVFSAGTNHITINSIEINFDNAVKLLTYINKH